MTNENFRRELDQVFDAMAGSPSTALSDRVRSSIAQAPEQRGPFWIAGVAAAVIAVVVIGVLVVANPLNRHNTVVPGAGSSPTPSASAQPSSSPSPSPTPPDSSLPPFVCASPTTIAGQGGQYIDDIRTGTHAGYDRLTIQFQGGQPQSIQLQPQTNTTFTRDGIGDTVQLAGKDGLLVSIFSAEAHTAYSGSLDIKTGYTGLLEVRVVGDFEGYVHLGLGLSQPACYRAFILTNPTRLVIDIQTS